MGELMSQKEEKQQRQKLKPPSKRGRQRVRKGCRGERTGDGDPGSEDPARRQELVTQVVK